MNYPRELNAFVDWLETNPLDVITQALWFHLMAINNKCNYPEWFTVANLTLQAKLGVDKKTIIKHRNILIQKRLITYKNQGRAAGRYQMLSNGGTIPPDRPPIQGPIQGPNRPPLNKLNKYKTDNQDIYTIFQHWNAQRLITHRQLSPGQQKHIITRLTEGYPVDEILAAIDNYAAVVHGDQYYWTHKWSLDEFLLRGLDKFKPASNPRANFLKEQSKAPQQAQGGADKYADYVNQTVGYDDL